MNCIKCKTELPDGAVFCHICGRKQVQSTRTPKSRGNGQGSVYKRGNTWVAQIKSHKGGNYTVKRKGGFERKKDALAYLDTLRVKRRDHTVAELWDTFSNNAMLKLSDSVQLKYNLAYDRIKDIQGVNMCDLTIEVIQNCVNASSKTFYPARDVKSLLSHLFKMAMAQQEVTVNLSQFVVLPELVEDEPVPFTDEELRKLWEDFESKDKNTGYILLMVYSGMMPGELFKCEKDMVHLDDQNIIGCGLKTKKRKELPIAYPDFIVPVLQELLVLSPTKHLLDMKRNSFYDWFHKKLEELGCRKELTPYACRHTTATALALGNKVASSVIQKIMRHAKFTTTQRYIHPDNADMLAGLNTLEKGLQHTNGTPC